MIQVESKFKVGDKVWWSQRTEKVPAIVVEIPRDNAKRGTVIVVASKAPSTRRHEVSEFWLEKREE